MPVNLIHPRTEAPPANQEQLPSLGDATVTFSSSIPAVLIIDGEKDDTVPWAIAHAAY